ncbi:MAG TPA: ABC transporter permease [Chloroflexota bacterium]|nr:ABC transporter permease [Chloroflexota bacterium]
MSQYILRRVLSMVPVLLIVSVIAFALLYVLPGDPAVAILGDSAGNQQTYLALRHDLGLDQPLSTQYLSWLGRVLQGDLGRSIRTNEAVSTVLLQRVPISVYLGAAGLVVGLVLGLSVAVVSALRPGSRIDSFGTLLAMGGVAIPSFWQALLLVYVFAVVLRWLPPSGFTSPFVDPLLSLRMLILPAIVLGTHSAAVIMRQGRSALMEVLEQDYVVTARAKGLGDSAVVARHAVKNAMIPLATVIGLQVGTLVSGAAITETVFAIPGVGRAAVDAIFFRDYPVLQGAVLILTLAVLLANLLTDVAYAYLDPRIRYR